MVNLKKVILTPDGKEHKQTTIDENEKTVEIKIDLKKSVVDALLHAPIVSDDYVSENVNRYEMYMNIKDVEEVQFVDKQLELLCKLVARRYDIFYAGQIIKMLKEI